LHSRLADSKADPALLGEFNEMNREMTVTVGKLQQAVMAVRRVPAGSLLNRIPSMVRQLGQQLGKQVEVVVEGGEILIDKSLLQELEGPMTHIVRNAMDHGFQPPEERERLGLSPTGVLRIRCRTEREFVLLEIIDDGRGIDRDKVLKLAVERGVLTPSQAAAATRDEIPMLLCRPGFSTADKISDVSGRGVGLDVVLNTVERNRGKLSIASELGRGTTFTLAFPLKSTVLMVDGLICESQDCYAAFSVDHVREVVRLRPEMLHSVGGSPTALVRGRTHPIVSLRSILGKNGSDGTPCEHGVLLEYQHRSALVSVESLNGYRKMVLKDFNRDMVRCDFLAGVAQLGGSRMALVLDVPELLRSIEKTG
jgi:two-component system chemotaxis sensor kinase CheA